MFRNSLIILVLFTLHLGSSHPATAQKPVPKQTIVTAAQVNGTWETKTGTFKILALGNQRLKVEFQGFYEYKTEYGPMANIGEGRGIAFIEGVTASSRLGATITLKRRHSIRFPKYLTGDFSDWIALDLIKSGGWSRKNSPIATHPQIALPVR